MKSEDFEGLNLEGLQQLEKSLESGLKRVIEMKVCMHYMIIWLIWTSNFPMCAIDLKKVVFIKINCFWFWLKV